ncbi:uncharacterized protein [Nicotiana tomentosiformis]|uniref:uncharacterized protein n=1 Tax=Nicotiana tomentosiformis TaxID=4098 RepID=UPI00388CCB54
MLKGKGTSVVDEMGSSRSKGFLNMKPPVFTGSRKDEDPKNIIDDVQKIFQVMHAIDTEASELAAYQLKDVANTWYETREESQWEDAAPTTWKEFADAFLEHFLPIEVLEAKALEFERLKKNDMSVNEYYLKFVSLAKYAPEMVCDMRARVRWFVLGLLDDLFTDANIVVQNSDMTITKMGHFLRDCPLAKQNNGGNVAQSTNLAAPQNFQAQQGCGATKSGNTGGGRNHLYALVGRQDIKARGDVVTSMLTVFTFDVYAFMDSGSTLSYVTPYIAMKFGIEPEKLCEPFEVSTIVGESVIARRIYSGCPFKVYHRPTVADLVEFEMADFDVIMGMDWLCHSGL